jgi:hypothetical protein
MMKHGLVRLVLFAMEIKLGNLRSYLESYTPRKQPSLFTIEKFLYPNGLKKECARFALRRQFS